MAVLKLVVHAVAIVVVVVRNVADGAAQEEVEIVVQDVADDAQDNAEDMRSLVRIFQAHPVMQHLMVEIGPRRIPRHMHALMPVALEAV